MTDELKPCPFSREELIDLIQIGIDNTMDIDTSSYHWAQGAADSLLKEWNTRTPTPTNVKARVARYARALEAAPQEGAPETVNHLNFANYGEYWAASTAFGSYFVTGKARGWEISQSFASPALLETKDSFELAKAYAEEDFSERLSRHDEENVLSTMLDTSDARIAELEAKVVELSWLRESDFRAELATARNEALEEAAKIAYSVNNHSNPMTANDVSDEIRALKTPSIAGMQIVADDSIPENVIEARHPDGRVDRFVIKTPDTQEVELKSVEPEVVYNLAAMTFVSDATTMESIFSWRDTPEGYDYWYNQNINPTAEGRDKIRAMREQFDRENA